MTSLLRWVQLAPAHNPASRTGFPVIVTDTVRNKIFQFQGEACGIPNHQSDAWNGSDWTSLGDVPTAADGATMAVWDVAHSKTLILSGYAIRTGFCDGGLRFCQGNNWYTFDGTTFTLVTPVHVPSPRVQPVASYSPTLGKVVLFGGYNQDDPTGCLGCGNPQAGPVTMFAETWLWDGTDFTQLVTATSPQYLQVVATLGNNIYGWGAPFTGSFPTQRSATLWKFDGTDWSIVTTAHTPPPRSWPAFAYWPSLGKIVMHGGGNANGTGPILSDTWSFDGTDWTLESPCIAGPPKVNPSASYDPVAGSYLMSGGQSTASCSFATANETWKLEQFTAADATTGAASANVCANATLNGTVNPHSSLAAVYFDYGLTAAYGASVFAGNFSGGSTAVAAVISGLTPGQTYHFRVRVIQSGCTIDGLDASFVQAACAAATPYLNTFVELGVA